MKLFREMYLNKMIIIQIKTFYTVDFITANHEHSEWLKFKLQSSKNLSLFQHPRNILWFFTDANRVTENPPLDGDLKHVC